MQVLYEDNHILALVKPRGIATMGMPDGVETFLDQAKEYIKRKYNKQGNVFLGTVSRLDTPVSGVIVFARTSKSAARLSEQFREHTVEKTYATLVEGLLIPPDGTLIDNIENDSHHRKVSISAGYGKHSVLHYKTLERRGGNSLLEIRLDTGRKHQIRIQLSSRGHSILGDYKYGNRVKFADGEGIALHAWKLRFDHPITKERIKLVTDVPF